MTIGQLHLLTSVCVCVCVCVCVRYLRAIPRVILDDTLIERTPITPCQLPQCADSLSYVYMPPLFEFEGDIYEQKDGAVMVPFFHLYSTS